MHVEDQLLGRGECLGLVERWFKIERSAIFGLRDRIEKFFIQFKTGRELDRQTFDLFGLERVNRSATVERLRELRHDPASLLRAEALVEKTVDFHRRPRRGMSRICPQ